MRERKDGPRTGKGEGEGKRARARESGDRNVDEGMVEDEVNGETRNGTTRQKRRSTLQEQPNTQHDTTRVETARHDETTRNGQNLQWFGQGRQDR